MNSEPHLDAETLAAWAEDRLSAAERDALEAHAADCERCQALLAAMVRTEPPAGRADAAPAWWRPLVGWVVPLGGRRPRRLRPWSWFVIAPSMTRRSRNGAGRGRIAEAPAPSPSPQATLDDTNRAARTRA